MAKWQPMMRARALPLHPTRRRDLERWAKEHGFDEDSTAQVIEEAQSAETWMNHLYVATILPASAWVDGWPPLKQLSIRRIDRAAIHDWRHLQRIKTDIFGPEAEAVELYPSERRVVDTANSYHLFVLAQPGALFPFGWQVGLRVNDGVPGIPGQQRPPLPEAFDGRRWSLS